MPTLTWRPDRGGIVAVAAPRTPEQIAALMTEWETD